MYNKELFGSGLPGARLDFLDIWAELSGHMAFLWGRSNTLRSNTYLVDVENLWVRMNTSQNQRAITIGVGLLLLLSLLTALDAMAIDMYLPAMPKIANEFGVSPGRIQQTLSIFLAGLSIGQAMYGPLLDRFGRRVPLLVGLAVFALGSILGVMAPSVEWLLAARFIQALGAAAGLVTPRAIVADLCNLTESAKIYSLLMQVMMIAPILAPLIGGFYLQHGGWRLIFWILGGLGIMGLIWSMIKIPDSLPVERRTPINLGHIARVYGQQIRNGVFMAYTLSGGFALSALFVYISGSAFVFTEYFNLSPSQFSYLFAGNSVGLVFGGLIASRLLHKGISSQRILVVGLVLHTICGIALFLSVWAGMANLVVYVGLLGIAIAALGLVFGNVTALAMNSAGAQVGVASALMGTLHYLTSALVGYIVSLTVSGPGQLPLAIGVCGILALLLYCYANHERVVQRQTV